MRPATRFEGCATNLQEPLGDARRIVSVGPSNTEILHVLGLGRRIVGVDRWSDYPPRVTRLPRVGSDLRVDVSQVLELDPEVVVASLHVPGMQANLPAFERAGLRYVAVGGVGLAGVWQDIRFVGQWLGRPQRAESLVQRMQAEMASLAAQVHGEPKRRLRVHWEWSAHPVVAGARSWVTELLDLVGADNAYADLDVESVRVGLDEVIRRQPDVVVACWCGVRRLPRRSASSTALAGKPCTPSPSGAWRCSAKRTLEDQDPGWWKACVSCQQSAVSNQATANA